MAIVSTPTQTQPGQVLTAAVLNQAIPQAWQTFTAGTNITLGTPALSARWMDSANMQIGGEFGTNATAPVAGAVIATAPAVFNNTYGLRFLAVQRTGTPVWIELDLQNGQLITGSNLVASSVYAVYAILPMDL